MLCRSYDPTYVFIWSDFVKKKNIHFPPFLILVSFQFSFKFSYDFGSDFESDFSSDFEADFGSDFESDFSSDFEYNFGSNFGSDFGSDNLISLSYSMAAFRANLFGLFFLQFTKKLF